MVSNSEKKSGLQSQNFKLENSHFLIHFNRLNNRDSFSVLCHGFPVQENFMFSYKRENNNAVQSFGQPIDAKLIKFNVKYQF